MYSIPLRGFPNQSYSLSRVRSVIGIRISKILHRYYKQGYRFLQKLCLYVFIISGRINYNKGKNYTFVLWNINNNKQR